jgi:hypothetical protein
MGNLFRFLRMPPEPRSFNSEDLIRLRMRQPPGLFSR